MRRDFTEPLPFALSTRRAGSVFQTSGAKFDISIDELPFLLAVSNDLPMTRETKQTTKQQLDTSKEPGEQSLSQWWVRSWDSWHRGAGADWYEPGSDDATVNRCRVSYGLDVWTKGSASLIKRMDLAKSTSTGQRVFVTGAVVNGVDSVYVSEAGAVTRISASGSAGYSGGSSKSGPVAVCGAKVVVGGTEGIWVADTTGTSFASLVSSSGAEITPYWVKSRIVATKGASLYELTLSSTALPAALYTHPDSGWTWTGVAETPDAILASGHGSGFGAVYAFTLVSGSSSGSTPTLGSAIQVAELPPGEVIHSIRTYLGAYVAVGTSAGVRVGIIGDGGKISLGPLTVETTAPVRSIAARDRFFYAAIDGDLDGNSGCARIDVSEEVEQGRYAWAYDADIEAPGTARSIAFLGSTGRVVIGVDGKGAYLQSDSQYVTSGSVYLGRVRYATTVPKVFAFAQVRTRIPGESSVNLSSVDEDGDETSEYSWTAAGGDDSDISLSTKEQARYSAELKITLSSSSDHSVTPILRSVSLKSLPQPKVQRTVTYPLLMSDKQSDRNGVKVGYTGFAWDRYSALENLEDTKTIVLIRDLRTGEAFPAWVDRLEFMNTQPPSKNDSNWGGVARVTLTRL